MFDQLGNFLEEMRDLLALAGTLTVADDAGDIVTQLDDKIQAGETHLDRSKAMVRRLKAAMEGPRRKPKAPRSSPRSSVTGTSTGHQSSRNARIAGPRTGAATKRSST